MDEQGASRLRRALAVAALVTLMAGDALRNLLSWWGFAAVALLVLVASAWALLRSGVDRRRVPVSLILFVGFAALSIAWSFYPGASAVGVGLTVATTTVALFLALGLPWLDLVDALQIALRWILALSLLLELFVAVVIRGPLLPLWVDYSQLDEIPRAFYWSRGLLLEGGRIQGIVGNANLLGMLALVALIVGLACLIARRGSRPWNVFWAVVALAALLLTRSTTVLVAGVAVAAVVAVAAFVKRLSGPSRTAAQLGALVIGVVVIGLVVAFRDALLQLAGRSPDLTHRVEIWRLVFDLAVERPVAGWGWVSWWAPWVEPYDDLVVIDGVTYLQAHNAWLDVLLQLGALGLIVFAVLAAGTLWRSWLMAAEPGRPLLDGLLPLALLTALFMQSLAESRMLVEWGWALLVVLAVRSTARSAPPAVPAAAGSSGGGMR